MATYLDRANDIVQGAIDGVKLVANAAVLLAKLENAKPTEPEED